MKEIELSELGAALGEYLRSGHSVMILDHQKAVAHITPILSGSSLQVRNPAPNVPAPNQVPLPELAEPQLDIVQLLLEERQGHR